MELSANHKSLGKKYLWHVAHNAYRQRLTLLLLNSVLWCHFLSLSSEFCIWPPLAINDVLSWKPDVQKGVTKLTTQCLHGVRNNHLHLTWIKQSSYTSKIISEWLWSMNQQIFLDIYWRLACCSLKQCGYQEISEWMTKMIKGVRKLVHYMV